jgi:2-keto-4-pentenoate hydratase/2-oxohepta-3-ene-1,7-dioic acid hydratase in catechol pathway
MKLAVGLVNGRRTAGDIDGTEFFEVTGDIFRDAKRTGTVFDLQDVSLESPYQPGKVLCVLRGWNPVDGSAPDPPAPPNVTAKLSSWVTGDGAEIIVPSYLTKPIWIEVELAVVLGRSVHHAGIDEARESIFGFTCFHDVTAFEYLAAHDMFRAKSIESFSSMGPCINTDITEEDVAKGLMLQARINGETVRVADSKHLKHRPSEVIHEVSKYTRLMAGDVISFGAPLPSPPPEGHPGDTVELEIEGIGVLRNSVVQAP